MKKNLFKLGALCLAAAMLFAIPASAVDYSHTQPGNGQASGNDSGNTSWTLNVNTSFASSDGAFAGGNTGTVQCDVTVNNTPYSSTGNNGASLTKYGTGNSAAVYFTLYTPPIRVYYGKTIVQANYGERSSSAYHCNWWLSVTSINAIAHGWMDQGYTDQINCYVFTTDNQTNGDTQWDNCQAGISGDGQGAEVYFD